MRRLPNRRVSVYRYPYTGIRRLDFYNLAQQGIVPGRQLPAGAKYPLERIQPRLVALESLPTLETDAEYNKKIRSYLGGEKDRYGVVVLDLSEPDNPIYAEHNALYKSNVGSVGKIVVAVALFQVLAELYPDDIAAREGVLRDSRVIADRFIEYDSHEVPIWNVENRKLSHRILRIGDEGSLWEYLDWMLSASSNAAASMVMRELLLLRHFRHDYPVSVERAQEYLNNASATELRELMLASLNGALESNGIDTELLRQGSFFTRYGKNRTGGVTSYGTPRGLITLLLRIEQGKLIDEFSSREFKRLLYMTQKRIRYASAPTRRSPNASSNRCTSDISAIPMLLFTIITFTNPVSRSSNHERAFASATTPGASAVRVKYASATRRAALRMPSEIARTLTVARDMLSTSLKGRNASPMCLSAYCSWKPYGRRKSPRLLRIDSR